MKPLRYKISSLNQLKYCKSNNSKELSISVLNYQNLPEFIGLGVQVNHTLYGTLFAANFGVSGCLIDDSISDITISELLLQLQRYGFLVEYSPYKHLSGSMIDLLMNLKAFSFDKLRVLSVWRIVNSNKSFDVHIVAFNIAQNPDWINANYACRYEEFVNSITTGSAIDVSAIAPKGIKLDWSWLYGWVADIDDVLAEQSGCSFEEVTS